MNQYMYMGTVGEPESTQTWKLCLRIIGNDWGDDEDPYGCAIGV